jgi:hypothetical protein
MMHACSSDTVFCGYSMPHPSEPKINVRLQTKSRPATDVFREALQQLIETTRHIGATFDAALPVDGDVAAEAAARAETLTAAAGLLEASGAGAAGGAGVDDGSVIGGAGDHAAAGDIEMAAADDAVSGGAAGRGASKRGDKRRH